MPVLTSLSQSEYDKLYCGQLSPFGNYERPSGADGMALQQNQASALSRWQTDSVYVKAIMPSQYVNTAQLVGASSLPLFFRFFTSLWPSIAVTAAGAVFGTFHLVNGDLTTGLPFVFTAVLGTLMAFSIKFAKRAMAD